jgi:NADH-quinone oxidoreductase subunit G
MAEIEIDGIAYPAAAGENLLKTCLSLGLNLPYFCWHPALGSVGACRQCAVIQYQNPEDQQGRLVMACMTPVAPGLRISLQAPQAQDFRAGIIELLMTNHPHDCPVCEEGGECHLQDMTEMSGHTFRRYRSLKRTHRNQNLGPFIKHEMNRCIACYRCVRFYQDYCGGDDLQVFAAHNHVYFGRSEDGVLASEFSGNLAEVCPTGVFTDKTFSRHYTRRWDLQSAPSVCAHCGLGCNTSPGEREGALRRIVNRYHGEINGYFLCDRGRFGYDFVNSGKRLRHCELRNQPPLSALGAANYFAKLLEKAQGVIGIGSPRASLEANFALREIVGAENFYAGIAAPEHACLRAIMEITRAQPVRIASLREIEQADAVFVLGEDVSNTAPRLALSLRQATRQAAYLAADRLKVPRWQDAAARLAAQQTRSPLFIASCAETRLDAVAAQTYRGAPEALARLGYAVAHALCPQAPSVDDLPPALAALAAGIAQALAAAERPLIVSGTGCQSAEVIHAAAQIACALAVLRGMRPTALHFAVPECNSLGLAMLEAKPLAQAFAAVESGAADTLIVLENDLYRRASQAEVDGLLAKARQSIALDALANATTAGVQLALPAASFAESEGTFISSEGRAQRFFSVFPPAEPVRPSWHWLRDGGRKHWANVEALTAACAAALPTLAPIAAAAPAAGFRIQGQKIPRQTHRYSGRTALLAHQRIHEPKQTVDAESALAFSMEGAQAGRPAALNPYVWAPGWNSSQALNKFQDEVGGALRGGDPGLRLLEPAAQPAIQWRQALAAAAPARGLRLTYLHLVFGSEELSMRATAVAERAASPYLALHPQDAAALGLQEGEVIEIRQGGALIRLPLRLLPGLAQGLIGIPHGWPSLAWLNLENQYWMP